MKTFKTLVLLALLLPALSFAQYTQDDIYKYVDTYKELAIKKMYEYKIPASITLAQGVLESACGTSRLATYGNNHFGIKCHGWLGDTIKVDDDELQECFRRYSKVEDSYNDHSQFLTSRSRYDGLFTLDIMDYKAWAKGLKAAGYATNPEYPNILIRLVETYQMAQYDTLYQKMTQEEYLASCEKVKDLSEQALVAAVEGVNKAEPGQAKKQEQQETQEKQEVTATSNLVFTAGNPDQYEEEVYPFTIRNVYINNRTLFVIALPGDTYKRIAKDVQLSERNLLKYNDLTNVEDLEEGQVVYIEKKQKINRGTSHKVKNKGETLYYVSQVYAVSLTSLCKINEMQPDAVLAVGTRIRLTH